MKPFLSCVGFAKVSASSERLILSDFFFRRGRVLKMYFVACFRVLPRRCASRISRGDPAGFLYIKLDFFFHSIVSCLPGVLL